MLAPLEKFRRFHDVLDSGLRLITVELPHLHSASIVMYARVGSRYESATDNGLSHFLEHMLFRGTARFPDAYLISHAIEALGGTLYAETGRDYSLYQLNLPPETLSEGIALMGEIFSTPTFDGIEVERRIILEEVLEDMDEDGHEININDVARAAVFPDHPLGFKITGPYQNVERFTDADIRRHFERCYGARNMIFAVTGAVEHERALADVRRAFADLPSGRLQTFEPPSDVQREPRFRYVENQGSQTSLQILFKAVPEGTPDYVTLLALGRILDDGMSTRLHHRVRDQLGLAYYVAASAEAFSDVGLYEVDASCAHTNVIPLLGESLAILSRLREEPPTIAELNKAKKRHRWDLESAYDDPDAMAGWWAGTELFFPATALEEKVARMDAVTPEQVSELARRIFRPDRLTVAAVGLLEHGLEDKVRRAVESFR